MDLSSGSLPRIIKSTSSGNASTIISKFNCSTPFGEFHYIVDVSVDSNERSVDVHVKSETHTYLKAKLNQQICCLIFNLRPVFNFIVWAHVIP